MIIGQSLLEIEMRKTQILTNKIVYLGLLILELSKTVMYEFWYDYMKPKCENQIMLYGYRQFHCLRKNG